MKFVVSVVLICFVFSCTPSFDEPSISLDAYHIEEGFDLSVIASEPLLKAPVAIDFDSKGRIWVAQMPGYMSDMQGSQEDEPIGSIQILEDLDNDGVVDHAKIFLDSLVMPRALAHVYGGLLYAEPPFLYFVEIEDDKPVNQIVVDSIYAVDGNPEHQPNGLKLNIDNWIYNAKSNFRYQRKNGEWKKEPTTFRGQWGISHDNFGRLYYNDNSRQVLGDHMLPNRLIRNQYFTPKAGVNQMLTKDQRVYPLHATSVNRGYAPGVLNADSILVKATAAAGSVVYRGGSFSNSYDQNVFVSIPEGNLIKRNVLSFTGDSTIAKQAWEGKEFLAATEEGFRPVSLNNGPDGSLYIVDMHVGMIGHYAYLSPYLKERNERTRLDTIINLGRILKVKSIGNSSAENTPPDFDVLNGTALVQLLKHKNGWVRDRAQHYIIYKGKKDVIPQVTALAVDTNDEIAQMHALYTLEGLDALKFDDLLKIAKNSSPDVTAHAIVLLENFASEENNIEALALFTDLINKNNATIDLYVASTLGKWMLIDQERFTTPMLNLLNTYKNRPIFNEAILSSLEGNESVIIKSLQDVDAFDNSKIVAQLVGITEKQKSGKVNPIFLKKSVNEDNRTSGAKMFYQICASCHGSDGQGIEGLAPPLMNSEHVADSERLGLIILHGVQGPITVKGKRYDLNLAMPGLIRNEAMTDKEIADIISYVTNAFSNMPKFLSEKNISELRALKPKSGAEYTEEELIDFSKNRPAPNTGGKVF